MRDSQKKKEIGRLRLHFSPSSQQKKQNTNGPYSPCTHKHKQSSSQTVKQSNSQTQTTTKGKTRDTGLLVWTD